MLAYTFFPLTSTFWGSHLLNSSTKYLLPQYALFCLLALL